MHRKHQPPLFKSRQSPRIPRMSTPRAGLTRLMPHPRNRPPHRWRSRDAERHFLIGYVGTAENRALKQGRFVPQQWRYEAAIFRLAEGSDRLLLWVAEEAIGSAKSRRVEAVHGGTRQDLWQAIEEAKQWAQLLEELGEALRLRAYTTFAEFEHAVGGLVSSTFTSLPRNLIEELDLPFKKRNFDL